MSDGRILDADAFRITAQDYEEIDVMDMTLRDILCDVRNFIATIRDRDQTIAKRDDTIYRLRAVIDARKTTDGLSVIEQQNVTLREALQCIRDETDLDIHEVKYIVREALAKLQDSPTGR